MKKAAIILGVVAAAGVGGHYMLWQQHSAAVSNGLEQAVAHANKKQKNVTFTLNYDEKSSRGYPADASVRYVNPSLRIESANDTAPMVDLVALKGDLLLTSDYLANKVTADMTGVLETNGTLQQQPFAYTTAWEGVSSCSVTLSDSPLTFVTRTHKLDSAKNVQDFVRALSAASCDTNGITVHDVAKAKDIARIDSQQITLESEAQNAPNHRIDVSFAMKGAEYMTNQSDAMRDFRAALEPLSDEQESYFKVAERYDLPVLDASYAGKQNIVFEASYTGPLDEKEMEDAASMGIDVTRFDVESDLYAMQMPFRLDMETHDGAKKFFIRHAGNTSYKEKFTTGINTSVEHLVTILHSPELVVDDATRAAYKRLTADALLAAVPDFKRLGTLSTIANLDISKDSGTVKIENFGFKTTPFDVTVAGTGAMQEKTVDAQILCRNCDNLITTMVNYANNVQQLLVLLEPDMQLYIVNDAARQALIDFIMQYDTDNVTETTLITVKSDASGQVMVSGTPMMEVVMAAMQQLQPHFQAMMPR